jgi:hypothetical protein
MQDIALRDPGASELARVGVHSDLKHMPLYITGMFLEKSIDVVAIDRVAAFTSPIQTDRQEPP